MTCVFSSSGCAAMYSTLPIVAKLRSCCRMARPTGGSAARPTPEPPASKLAPRTSPITWRVRLACPGPAILDPLRARSLNDVIRPQQQRRRDREAQRPSRVEVDHQIVLRRLLYGQVAWLGSFEDLVHVDGGASNLVVKVHRIGHEATDLDKLLLPPHRRYPALGGEVNEGFSMLSGQNTRGPEKRVGALPRHRDKGALELARCSHLERLQCKTQGRGRLLQLLQYQHIGLVGRIVEDRHAGSLGGNRLEEFQPFPA